MPPKEMRGMPKRRPAMARACTSSKGGNMKVEFDRQECEPGSLCVESFCNRNSISKADFYAGLRNGTGPRIYKSGRATLITREAEKDWRREREAAATQAKNGAVNVAHVP